MDPLTVEELKKKLEQQRYYNDTLALAVALTNSSHFKMKDWYKVIHDICEGLSEVERELLMLNHVRLTERGYSEEVDNFLSIMCRSGLFSRLTRGRQAHYVIYWQGKLSVILGNLPLLQEHKDTLVKMAKRLDEELGVKDEL